MNATKPIIGISMGDPAGIGPEIIVKAFLQPEVHGRCLPIVVGDARVMLQAVKALKADLKVVSISTVEEALFAPQILNVFDLKNVVMAELKPGEVSAMAGNAAFEAVRKVIELALAGEIDATVTAPINKESIHKAGHHFSGHTEIYAHFTGTDKFAMLLADENLRVIHATTHVSLRKACDLCKKDRILDVIKLLDDACKQFGIPTPRIAVAGLNPHAGENGLFGDEEILEIIPAIAEANANGFTVEGPIPPDTMFVKAVQGKYDGCVAMYHDQGHIPFKLEGFQWDNEKQTMKSVKGVNITLGLPIIRTSVDHGTAFEIAGKGIASADAMLVSIDYAIRMAQNRKKMITILADDITGAAEIAGVCLRSGLTVSFGVNTIPSAKTQARVIATDSRSMSNQEARLLHRSLAEAIGTTSAQSVFKKTDSVLRGHVVAELDEWMDVLGYEEAVLQPANPAAGRCIQEGRYLIDGIDLHATAFLNDSDFPAWTSSVEGLLMERNGNHPSRKIHTGNCLPLKKGIHVPDCQQVADLKKSVLRGHPAVLHAGSAAFFAAWLEEVHDLIPKPQPQQLNPLQGRFLMVCGSKHTQSEKYLTSSKKKGLAVAEFTEELLKETISDTHLLEWADNQAEFWGRTGQMIVTQGHRKVNFPGHAKALRNRLAEVVIRMLEQCAVGELLLEGGATTFALLEKKGWTTLTPILEFSPGIVRMAVSGKPNLFLTLKPGSYPWPAWEGNQSEEPIE